MTLEATHEASLRGARSAGARVAIAPAEQRRAWLGGLADALVTDAPALLAANAEDHAAAVAAGADAARLDRLRLDERRLAQLAAAVREIAAQPDPLAETEDLGVRPSGIRVRRVRSPLGLIGMVYEARPNVTIDAAALAVYAGNAIVLRPGREIRASAQALGNLLHRTLEAAGLPGEAVLVVDDPDRAWFRSLLAAAGIVDLLIPRGGASLIRAVEAEARVPVLAHATGVCHTYVDASADLEQAVRVVVNAKAQRPGVCNATEGLLLDRAGLDGLLAPLVDALVAAGVTLHGSEALAARDARVVPDGDVWRGHEWLSLDLTVQVVDGIAGAISYIANHGSGHTEAVLATDPAVAARFVREVQASAVMVNASTRFNDGGELGLGAEIGISTTRLHAWGPMGALALTTQRWVVEGEGAVRA
ncbi:MAG: glutamate-5-semialdehyde dehydrogenase [Candidatus Sericytochromatia bacterium]|nr:glutamate-5-semialdehyde dehydrogenase [Candidatus Sericytochromatia bacterium]